MISHFNEAELKTSDEKDFLFSSYQTGDFQVVKKQFSSLNIHIDDILLMIASIHEDNDLIGMTDS